MTGNKIQIIAVRGSGNVRLLPMGWSRGLALRRAALAEVLLGSPEVIEDMMQGGMVREHPLFPHVVLSPGAFLAVVQGLGEGETIREYTHGGWLRILRRGVWFHYRRVVGVGFKTMRRWWTSAGGPQIMLTALENSWKGVMPAGEWLGKEEENDKG